VLNVRARTNSTHYYSWALILSVLSILLLFFGNTKNIPINIINIETQAAPIKIKLNKELR